MLTKVQEQVLNRNPNDSLTNVLIPSIDGGFRDIYRAGWQPAGFNQQWGGSQWGAEIIDGFTGNLYKFDVATGNIEDNDASLVASAANLTYLTNGFKVSDTTTCQAIWVKLYKAGNSSNNLTMRILPDDGTGTKPTGNTPITNGTATPQSHRVATSNGGGEWYRFIFPTPPSLTAGTVYHVTLSSSGAVDGSNYWGWRRSSTRKYPFGSLSSGDATPAWTASTGYSHAFLVESVSAGQLLQPAGQFDGKLVTQSSSQPSQLKVLCQPLEKFFDGRQFTFLQRGNWPASSTIADFILGLDHDRIQIGTNASGFAVATLWRSDRTSYTVTGTTSVVTGFHDVAVKARTVGDGADILELWVDGVVQGTTLTAQTFTMSTLMRDSGTAWIGGGFTVPPTWTQDVQMTTLPSTQGWTWTGTTTEANAMTIQSNKLFQTKTGYNSTDTGYYTKTVVLNNTTGWTVSFKVKAVNNTNTYVTGSATSTAVVISDGTKALGISITEFFVHANSTTNISVQQDNKSKDHIFTICGKGSDYYIYSDGRLIIDGTGSLNSASATNAISMGDINSTAGENGDAVWSYMKYYQGGITIPVASVSGVVQETAYWSGNKTTSLPALWNAGNPIGLKRYLGLSKNYVENVAYSTYLKGITSGNSTTSAGAVILPEMETYCLGSSVDSIATAAAYNNTGGSAVFLVVSTDNVNDNTGGLSTTANANYADHLYARGTSNKLYLGLHKIEGRWAVTANTAFLYTTQKSLKVTYNS